MIQPTFQYCNCVGSYKFSSFSNVMYVIADAGTLYLSAFNIMYVKKVQVPALLKTRKKYQGHLTVITVHFCFCFFFHHDRFFLFCRYST